MFHKLEITFLSSFLFINCSLLWDVILAASLKERMKEIMKEHKDNGEKQHGMMQELFIEKITGKRKSSKKQLK